MTSRSGVDAGMGSDHRISTCEGKEVRSRDSGGNPSRANSRATFSRVLLDVSSTTCRVRLAGPPGTAPFERDWRWLQASRSGWTLHANFEWSRLVAISQTSRSSPTNEASGRRSPKSTIGSASQPDHNPNRSRSRSRDVAPPNTSSAFPRGGWISWSVTESWSRWLSALPNAVGLQTAAHRRDEPR